MDKKIKLAIGLSSTCSGCDIAILDINEKILDLAALADIVFWPTALDFKHSDLEKIGHKEVDITLYHGTIRNSDNLAVAKELREKSKVMIAFGSCACFGGIPGLSNFTNQKDTFEVVYRDAPSMENKNFVTPQVKLVQNGYELTLPEIYNDGRALQQVVDVDYYVPGCPPAVRLIAMLLPVIGNFIEKGELPPKGAVIASDKTLCDECPRTRENKMISKVYRSHELIPDQKRCLLEQGLLCMGPATRGGCGAQCINAFMPCRGCMGPTAEVKDQGAKMVSALASILGVENEKDLTEEDVTNLINQVVDPAGTFYRFTLPVALLNRKVRERS